MAELAEYVVDGVVALCDDIGPIRRCPCREHPMVGWEDPAFVPHWWAWERNGQSGTFWCNVGPVGGWRGHAQVPAAARHLTEKDDNHG